MSGERWLRAHRLRGFDQCFSAYVRWLLERSFAHIWMRRGAARLPPGGYVAVANHSSWWDGFVPYYLQRAADPRKPFAIMMNDVELRRFPFFRWAGAFSVDRSSVRAALPAIRYAASQAQLGAGVWIFPEGELRSGASALPFTSGFVHAARAGNVPIVPVAMRFAMRTGQRPEVLIDIAPSVDARRGDARAVTEATIRESVAGIEADLAAGEIEQRYIAVLNSNPGVDARVAAATAAFRRWRS